VGSSVLNFLVLVFPRSSGCEHAGVALALMACLPAGVNCDARLGAGEFGSEARLEVVEVGVLKWASELWFGCSCFAPVRWQLRR
jgi:hypothetical protein